MFARKRLYTAIAAAMLGLTVLLSRPVMAGSAADIDANVSASLASLYAKDAAARELGSKARGILLFPAVVKAGFLVGGHYGEGALRIDGKSVGYFYTSAVSYGLQAGGQKYGYAMFFMTDEALDYLEDSGGFEVGVGPNVVVLDQGMAKTVSTTTQFEKVYAIIFDQTGLMAGMGLQGSKISEFIPR